MRYLILILFSACAIPGLGQATISDSLTWVAGFPVSSQTSPVLVNCDGSNITYELSTAGSESFQDIVSSGNPLIPFGAIFPANTSATSTNQIPITIQFSQPVSNLAIWIRDIDEDVNGGLSNPEEFLNGFSTPPDSVASSNGVVFWNGSSVTSQGNDVDLWLKWDTDQTQVSFIYNRPGSGYGLILSTVRFNCPDSSVAPPIPSPQPSDCSGKQSMTIPNIFTPNSDSDNRTWRVRSDTCNTIVSAQIFNRWGQVVFNSDRSEVIWDGRTNAGEPVPSGTYYYILGWMLHSGEPKETAGYLQLVR